MEKVEKISFITIYILFSTNSKCIVNLKKILKAPIIKNVMG